MIAEDLRTALSGISGSISLASWIVVLMPQLIENYRTKSGDALALNFIVIWFLGDLLSFLGAIWGGLLPSIIILSAYFIIADSSLIFQILYFRKHHYHPIPSRNTRVSSESNPLLPRRASFRESPPSTRIKIIAQYIGALAVVIASGVIGWSLSSENHPRETPVAKDDIGPKILGYLSAVLYLSARIPQIYHNFKLKSTEGLSLLFFMFSTLGNFSFAASILFAVTDRDYFLLNLPWLIGSAGTIFFDFTIFAQFFWYRGRVGGLDWEEAVRDD